MILRNFWRRDFVILGFQIPTWIYNCSIFIFIEPVILRRWSIIQPTCIKIQISTIWYHCITFHFIIDLRTGLSRITSIYTWTYYLDSWWWCFFLLLLFYTSSYYIIFRNSFDFIHSYIHWYQYLDLFGVLDMFPYSQEQKWRWFLLLWSIKQ